MSPLWEKVLCVTIRQEAYYLSEAQDQKMSNKENKKRIVNTEDSYQDIVKLTEVFKRIPYQNVKYIKTHDKKNPAETYLFLLKQLSKLINDKKHVLRNEEIIPENESLRRIVQQEFGRVKYMCTEKNSMNKENKVCCI